MFEGRFATVRRCVEAAVATGIDLNGVNLRGAMLRHAMLDGACLRGACLWGARLEGVQMAGGDCRGADLRAAAMKDACLAESDFSGGDFRGAYMGGVIVRAARFDACEFSCPSIFTVPWEEAASLHDAVYWHRGEIPCALTGAPLVISGLPQRVVMMPHHVLVGMALHSLKEAQPVAK